MFDIDRKSASRLLKVSIRTVDRYIAAKKINFENREGRIWLDRKEILRVRQIKAIDRVDTVSMPRMSIDGVDVPSVDMSMDNQQSVYSRKSENGQRNEQKNQEEVYKKLFLELQLESKEKQVRLEGANYRVGQLEARLKESIPLLDYKRDVNLEREQKDRLHKNLVSVQREAEDLLHVLKEERLNKKIYLIILFILLALQPLWFIFPLK